jgi:hypothetical protein
METVRVRLQPNLIRKSLEFGQGTPRPRSHFRAFALPVGSRIVGVDIEDMAVTPANESAPVIVELRRPTQAA